jgi:hypothetical protein
MQLPIKIRQIQPSDHAFIFDAWCETVRPFFKYVDKRLFRSAMNERIKDALGRCAISHGGFVVCDENEPDQIFALQVVCVPIEDVAVIDFAFTKSFYWRMGLQRMLLESYPESQKVLTLQAKALGEREFQQPDGTPLALHLKNKYGIVLDPFFHERT